MPVEQMCYDWRHRSNGASESALERDTASSPITPNGSPAASTSPLDAGAGGADALSCRTAGGAFARRLSRPTDAVIQAPRIEVVARSGNDNVLDCPRPSRCIRRRRQAGRTQCDPGRRSVLPERKRERRHGRGHAKPSTAYFHPKGDRGAKPSGGTRIMLG